MKKKKKLSGNTVDNHDKQQGLWWPKRVYKTLNLNYDKLLSSFYNVFPTDGWIIYADKTYKIKPLNHLTIDLKYSNNQFFSKEGTKFDGELDLPSKLLEKNAIYRLVKRHKWMVQSRRMDKKTANPNKIVDLILHQHNNPINFNKIVSIFKNTKLYYQNFIKIEKPKREIFISKYSNSNRIIDIGCGFKCQKNSKLMKSKYYLGVDIDSKLNTKK